MRALYYKLFNQAMKLKKTKRLCFAVLAFLSLLLLLSFIAKKTSFYGEFSNWSREEAHKRDVFFSAAKKPLSKKILVITFNLHDMGAPLMFLHLTKLLHQKGYNVFLLSWDGGRHEEDLKNANIPYYISKDFYARNTEEKEKLFELFDVVISGRIPEVYIPSQEHKFIWWDHGLLDCPEDMISQDKTLNNFSDNSKNEPMIDDTLMSKTQFENMIKLDNHFIDTLLLDTNIKEAIIKSPYIKNLIVNDDYFADVIMGEIPFMDRSIFKNMMLADKQPMDILFTDVNLKNVITEDAHFKNIIASDEHFTDILVDEGILTDDMISNGQLPDILGNIIPFNTVEVDPILRETKFVVSNASDVVFVSELQQQKLSQCRKLPSEVIHNGVNPTGTDMDDPITEQIQEAKKDGKTVFVTIGYIDHIKGQDILVDAINLLPEKYRKKASFFIVGSKKIEKYADDLIEKSSDIPEIVWAGPIIHEKIGGIYESADVLLVPSRSDTAPLVVSEAAEHNMPSVITDNVGSTYITQNKKSGFVIPKEDPKSLAEKIKFFIDNPNKIKEYGKVARQNYDNFSSLDAFEEKWIDKITRKFREIQNQK